jgi:hypothetical protein
MKTGRTSAKQQPGTEHGLSSEWYVSAAFQHIGICCDGTPSQLNESHPASHQFNPHQPISIRNQDPEIHQKKYPIQAGLTSRSGSTRLFQFSVVVCGVVVTLSNWWNVANWNKVSDNCAPLRMEKALASREGDVRARV